MRFCQSFMTELYRHIGEHTDVPAGDIGVGGREIGYLFGQYKRITNRFESGVLTGKGWPAAAAWCARKRPGYGCTYFVEEMLKAKKNGFKGKKVVVSGSGNVAIYTLEKIQQLGGKVIAMSDSNGVIVDEKGFNLETIKTLKEVERRRIKDYCDYHKHAKYVHGGNIWDIPCDVAMPSRHPERADREGRPEAGEERLHRRRRGREHADHAGRRPGVPERGRAFRPGQGRQRGRRGHLGARNAAERQPGSLGLRADRRQAAPDHGISTRSVPRRPRSSAPPGTT